MKYLLTLILFLPLMAYSQLSLMLNAEGYKDGSTNEVREKITTYTLNVGAQAEIDLSLDKGDGHALEFYGEMMLENDDNFKVNGYRGGFRFMLNALPILNTEDLKMGFKIGPGMAYDSTLPGGVDFTGTVRAYVTVKRLTVHAQMFGYVLENYFYNEIMQYNLGVAYRIGG